MNHQHWINNTIRALEEEGLQRQAGAPLLALSQYATEPLSGKHGSIRILQVVHVRECEGGCERVYAQVWKAPNAVDIHVTKIREIAGPALGDLVPEFDIRQEWMLTNVHLDLAYDLIKGFASGLPLPGPDDVVETHAH